MYTGSSISGEILVGELLPKVVSANQIAGFFKRMSKSREVSFDFLLAKGYSLELSKYSCTLDND